MYVLKQADSIAYNEHISPMESHGYYIAPFATGLWAHKPRKKIAYVMILELNIFPKIMLITF